MKARIAAAVVVGCAAIVCLCPQVRSEPALTYPAPFSPAANYMSLPGYLRWQNFLKTGNWRCQGQVKLCTLYADSQDGGPDSVSGMDVRSMSKVLYTLAVDGDKSQVLPFIATCIQVEPIFGAVIKVEFLTTFCIGRSFRYVLTTYVEPGGLSDMVGNGFNEDCDISSTAACSWSFPFFLDYDSEGRVVCADLKRGKKFPLYRKDEQYYLRSPEDFVPPGAAREAHLRAYTAEQDNMREHLKDHPQGVQEECRPSPLPPLFKPGPDFSLRLRRP